MEHLFFNYWSEQKKKVYITFEPSCDYVKKSFKTENRVLQMLPELWRQWSWNAIHTICIVFVYVPFSMINEHERLNVSFLACKTKQMCEAAARCEYTVYVYGWDVGWYKEAAHSIAVLAAFPPFPPVFPFCFLLLFPVGLPLLSFPIVCVYARGWVCVCMCMCKSLCTLGVAASSPTARSNCTPEAYLLTWPNWTTLSSTGFQDV